MENAFTYQIHLRGKLDEADFNTLSPTHVTVESVEENTTQILAQTDQAGLIGLLRHLHGQGFELLYFKRL
jgi:hypothetical protein